MAVNPIHECSRLQLRMWSCSEKLLSFLFHLINLETCHTVRAALCESWKEDVQLWQFCQSACGKLANFPFYWETAFLSLSLDWNVTEPELIAIELLNHLWTKRWCFLDMVSLSTSLICFRLLSISLQMFKILVELWFQVSLILPLSSLKGKNNQTAEFILSLRLFQSHQHSEHQSLKTFCLHDWSFNPVS